MNSISQDTHYRLSLLSYAKRFGVSKASRKYHVNRQFIYRLRWRYDGSPDSLLPHSRRPHSHPNQHTEQELALIRRIRRRNPHDGLVVFWVKLCQHGYTRSISGLYRVLQRSHLAPVKLPNHKYVPKPYEKAFYPGQKVQVDVKVVPSACIVGQAHEKGKKFYQYTAIDECTRFRFLAAFEEQNTFASMRFLQQLVHHFPFPIHKIQTDNGFEFTKRFSKDPEDDLTLFEKQLRIYHIQYQKIKPYTPRHNGKVERSHRKDNEYFYARHQFYSYKDFQHQLKVWNRVYNAFPMRPLHWKSPKEFLSSFSSTL